MKMDEEGGGGGLGEQFLRGRGDVSVSKADRERRQSDSQAPRLRGFCHACPVSEPLPYF